VRIDLADVLLVREVLNSALFFVGSHRQMANYKVLIGELLQINVDGGLGGFKHVSQARL
jgi:hypothetical protein